MAWRFQREARRDETDRRRVDRDGAGEGRRRSGRGRLSPALTAQIYATANIPLFKKAKICIGRRGWIEDYFAPKFPMHVPRHLRVPDDVMKHLLFEARDRIRLLEDEDEIVPGVRHALGRCAPPVDGGIRHRYREG